MILGGSRQTIIKMLGKNDFYITFKKELFSAEGIDNWHLFKTVKNWHQENNQQLEYLK